MFPLKTLKNTIMQRSRTKKLDHFYSLYRGGNVLDVGVSGKERLPAVNMFLKNFRYAGQFYTGLGVQDLTEVAARHPDKRFVRYTGGMFPFKDNAFDWVFSNSVIEHVGDNDAQLKFVNEMLRVGKNVFFTTPNKYFPIETHTNVLFLHWNDDLFYTWCAWHNKPYRKNLHIYSYSKLNALMKEFNAVQYEIHKNLLLGFTVTFTVICRRHNERREHSKVEQIA
jgi:2-polyprenyl-3-methyl-5-hydroxy-6-metoxy-1,4-benzoquinol methylase